MDFLDTIIKHYLRESHQGFGAAIFGGLLLIASTLLFKFARPLSLLKGLSIPFLLVGLVMSLGGSSDGLVARRSMSQSAALYQKDKKAFFDGETVKVEKTHRSWRGIIMGWGVLTGIGVLLLLGVRKSYWTGVALGTILVSMAGHIEEAISRNFNERYYHQVMDESKKPEQHDVGKPSVIPPTGTQTDSTGNHRENGKQHLAPARPYPTKDGPVLNMHLEFRTANPFPADTVMKDTIG